MCPQVCCQVLECVPVISALLAALKTRPDLVGLCVEALHNLLQGQASQGLHQQAAQVRSLYKIMRVILQVLNVADVS